MKAVVTVVGTDKIGIVAGVTAALAEQKANILEISQTLLSGAFTMMMLVDLPENTEFADFQAQLKQNGEQLGVNIHVQNQLLFDAMHKL